MPGSEKYYSRVGYVPAGTLGILPSFDVSRENFRGVNGVIEYAKEFGIE